MMTMIVLERKFNYEKNLLASIGIRFCDPGM